MSPGTMRLSERWRTTVPGFSAHCLRCDSAKRALLIGDGWGAAYASLALRMIDLNTGRDLQRCRTRYQQVSAIMLAGDRIYAATESRLFELDLELSVLRQWERNLVRNTMQLVPTGDQLVAANWLMESIGIFDLRTGRVRRVRAGRQPLVFPHRGEVMVLAGFDGGLYILDCDRHRLTTCASTPPISAVAAGEEIWAVLAGPVEPDHPTVPTRRGSERLLKVGDRGWTARLPDRCSAISCDDEAGTIWCLLGGLGNRGGSLVQLSQADGRLLAMYSPPDNCAFVHVDPPAGVAFAVEGHTAVRAGRIVSATATLVCLELAR